MVSKSAPRFCAVAVVVAISVASCSTRISGVVNQPLPPDPTFLLGDISGMDYSGEHSKPREEGGMQLNIHNYTVDGDPSHTQRVSFGIWTACGMIQPLNTDITADRLIVTGPATKLDSATCTSEQLAVSEKMAALLASDPYYDYNGKHLRLKSDAMTVTFELIHKTPS